MRLRWKSRRRAGNYVIKINYTDPTGNSAGDAILNCCGLNADYASPRIRVSCGIDVGTGFNARAEASFNVYAQDGTRAQFINDTFEELFLIKALKHLPG